MKKRFLFTAILFTTIGVSVADTIHCESTYQGKPFVQATIWSDTSGFGKAECDYKNKGDNTTIAYKFPPENEYYRVAGNWQSTMPGYQWCSVDNGGTYDICKFALREKKL